MKNGYIALLDSGIGGISLLCELIKNMPNEKYLYFGDNVNAPYGNKSLSTLREITLKNIDFIKQYNIKILVVACNTLSVNLLKEIETYSGIKTFGVFPPIEKMIMENKKNLLLSTIRTAEKFKGVKGLDVVGLSELAEDIERNKFCLNNVSVEKNLKFSNFIFNNKSGYYDSVILGCTHYFFVKNKIYDHFRPRKIIFGEKFTAITIKNYLINLKSLENYKRNTVLFVGENAKINQNFFNICGREK